MEKINLFEFYQKLYFHEIEMREKLNNRMQIPLAILITLIGFWGYMLENLFFHDFSLIFIIFIVLFSLCAVFLGMAAYFIIKSWLGHEYLLFPSANETDEYREKLQSMYEDYDECDDLVDRYMKEYINGLYISCSTNNTRSNDSKSYYLHLTGKRIIYSAILVILSFIIFHFGDLDNSGELNNSKIHGNNTIKIHDMRIDIDDFVNV